MANTHIADKAHHMAAAEHIPHQAFAFALMQLAIGFGDNTCGVLPAMLKHCQRIIKP
jgi:hypothetical protein